MRKPLIGLFVVLCLVLLPIVSEIAKRIARSHQTRADLLASLAEPIETKDLATPMTLKDMLGLLYEKMAGSGIELPIVVDSNAFREEAADAPDPLEAQVNLPTVPRTMSLEKALRHAVNQLPTNNGAIVVREGYVEVTTQGAANPERLLKKKMLAQYNKRPLADILQELSDRAAVSIILDPHLGDRATQEITASFRQDTSVKEVLTILMRMTDLHAEILPDSVFVTTPAAAR